MSKNQSAADELSKRTNRVVESILENETLTADLDDVAAKELLDWAIAWVKMIAQSTADLDDADAEDAMYPRLRATRRLMRGVNRWIGHQEKMDTEASARSLTKIIEQVAIIYGDDFTPPPNDELLAFTIQQAESSENPQQMIINLRQLLQNSISIATQGDNDDQKN